MQKRRLLILIFVACAFIGLSWNNDTAEVLTELQSDALCYHVHSVQEFDQEQMAPDGVRLGDAYVAFKEAIAFKESQGRYDVVNTLGYLGKYQFNNNTLRLIGIEGGDAFLQNSLLQETAFLAYTARNKWVLRRDLGRYSGTYINGIEITESGILAAAHLAGAGNVKKYLRSNGNFEFQDAFGTRLEEYLSKFSGYDISVVPTNRDLLKSEVLF
jgi:hypothetical protein